MFPMVLIDMMCLFSYLTKELKIIQNVDLIYFKDTSRRKECMNY